MDPSFVYINGYPGVGKLTVAHELSKLITNSKVVDNHHLIDPVAMVYDRTMPEYQPLRRAVRVAVLDSIAKSPSTKDITWICTDQQSSSSMGSAAAIDYARAAASRGSRFVSVILTCEAQENERRLAATGRGGSANTKLTDVGILRMIREKEDIYRFGGKDEVEIDVTTRSAEQTAQSILEFMNDDDPESVATAQLGQPSPIMTFESIPGFKQSFIEDVRQRTCNGEVKDLLCWVKSRPRHHGGILFLDVVDSTASIQVVFKASSSPKYAQLLSLVPESSVMVSGTISRRNDTVELLGFDITVISMAVRHLAPSIRTIGKELLSSKHTHNVLKARHIYLRNPLLASLNKFRSKAFSRCDYAIHIANLKESRPLYLSQCAGFYLEAGAHVHERVYNLGPSFRNESRTNRHLMEYWHIKAELCSGTMNDIISLVEVFLRDIALAVRPIVRQVCTLLGTECPNISIPFHRITYRDAIALLQEHGHTIRFGDNISRACEDDLTNTFNGPVWVTHKPRALEPFPYSLDKHDNELTMTADLIAPAGFGEICGVAEKSYRKEELDARLIEKGKDPAGETYGWVRDLRDFGMVPHTAFGMGFERLLRWLVGTDHVKDVIPFPRVFGRDPLP